MLALENKLQIEPLKKTDLIQVTYDSPDPQLAARVLHTLGNLYLEKTVEVHRPPGAFEFFQAESQHYDQELQTAEAQLAKFDREKGVADPQLEKQIALQKLSEFEATFNETQVAIKETEKRTRVVEEQLASTPEQTVSQVRSSENPFLMQQLKTTLLELELKRTGLLERFEPDYRPCARSAKTDRPNHRHNFQSAEFAGHGGNKGPQPIVRVAPVGTHQIECRTREFACPGRGNAERDPAVSRPAGRDRRERGGAGKSVSERSRKPKGMIFFTSRRGKRRGLAMRWTARGL